MNALGALMVIASVYVAPPVPLVYAAEYTISVPHELGCIEWLREMLGVNVHGDADKIKPNTGKIERGVVILFTYGHGALITRVKDSLVTFHEFNFYGQWDDYRTIDLGDPKQSVKIKGFYDPTILTSQVL